MLKAEWGLFLFKTIASYMVKVEKSQEKKEIKEEGKILESETVMIQEIQDLEKRIAMAKEVAEQKITKAKELAEVAKKEREKARKVLGKLSEFLDV